jgi:hypothetical protein
MNNSTKSFTYNFENVVLYDFDGNESTTNDQIVANGSISFDTDVTFEVEIEDSLKKLFFESDFISNFNLAITSSGDFLEINKSKKIVEFDGPLIYFITPTTPPVPIIITTKIGTYIDINGSFSQLSTSLNQDATLTLGASYNGQWDSIYSFQTDFQFNLPQFPRNIKSSVCALGRLSAYLYDFAGIYAEPKGGLEFESWIEGTNRYWEFSGKLQGDLGIDMNLFGRSIANFNTTLIDYSKILASGNEQLLLKTITIQPRSGDGKDMSVRTTFYPSGGDTYQSYDDSYLDVYSSSASKRDSLIQFPFSSVPFGLDIFSAKLQLYGCGAYYGESPDVKIYKILTPWEESEWGPASTNQGPSYGEFITSSTMINETKWYEWNITSLVQSWIDGESNYGLALTTNCSRPIGEEGFRSSDCTDLTKHPKIIINYFE